MQKPARQLLLHSLRPHKERGQQCFARSLVGIMVTSSCALSTSSYEDAVAALNSLQSNAAYIRQATKLKRPRSEEALKLTLTRSYLELIGLTSVNLSSISVIHVAGTKGKGSTSAYCESILRHHGYRTGFFSSPHLVTVRERIRINGKPLPSELFTEYFWQVYNTINEKMHSEGMMPSYFMFLTIMALKVFLNEMVDVAILEVGIGGEFDSTNILDQVSVVGITSLGLDHTALLGNSMSEIAWQKAGILKPTAIGFTVDGHSQEALKVLADRSHERKCPLWIAPPLEKYNWPDNEARQNVLSLFPTQQLNASLALQIAYAWMNRAAFEVGNNCTVESLKEAPGFSISHKMCKGLLSCRWPGRNQVLVSDSGKITYFIDGAHTPESMEACVTWFNSLSVNSPNKHRALVINLTGDRDGAAIFQPLLLSKFDIVTFSPNVAFSSVMQGDSINLRSTKHDQMVQVKQLSDIWNSMAKTSSTYSTCIAEALAQVEASDGEWNVLVTGSLHLVGALLSILDPNLEKSEGS